MPRLSKVNLLKDKDKVMKIFPYINTAGVPTVTHGQGILAHAHSDS